MKDTFCPEGVPGWSLHGIVCIGEMLKSAVRLTKGYGIGCEMKTVHCVGTYR